MSDVALSDSSRVVASKDQVSRELGRETAILNLKNSTYYGLDPVGNRIWNLIQEPRTVAEIRDALLDEYEVGASKLEADLKQLLSQMIQHGLVDIENSSEAEERKGRR